MEERRKEACVPLEGWKEQTPLCCLLSQQCRFGDLEHSPVDATHPDPGCANTLTCRSMCSSENTLPDPVMANSDQCTKQTMTSLE